MRDEREENGTPVSCRLMFPEVEDKHLPGHGESREKVRGGPG
jgi:hypothetical protein